MGDVEATIHLARLLREKAPDLWSASMQFSQKATASDHLQSERLVCFGEHYYGKPYAWTVTFLGVNHANNADHLVYDLSVDPESLIDLDDDDLASRLGRSPKPVRTVKVNAAPIFLPFPDFVGATSCHSVDEEILEERASFIEGNQDFRDRLVDTFLSIKKAPEESSHVEAKIYAGFTSDADWKLLDKFHQSPWEQRQAILAKLNDDRLKELGLRLIFLERPDVLDLETRKRMELWNSDRLLGVGDCAWLSLEGALEKLEKLMDGLDADGCALLEQHKAWLEKRLASIK
jgi:exodeoxyribonuclease-1